MKRHTPLPRLASGGAIGDNRGRSGGRRPARSPRPDTPTDMFSVIFVAYNSGHVLADAIASVPAGHEVIVVDNASADDGAAIAEAAGAKVVRNAENLGFGRACNIGAAVATMDNLMFLNPDARLRDGALDRLEAAIAARPDCKAFNPRFHEPDGRQFFRRRTRLIRRPYLFRFPVPTEDREIFFAYGAALAMRRSDFREFGGFDDTIFLFYEDDDLSARIIKSGAKILYVHDAVVDHLMGKSSSGDWIAGFMFKVYQENRAKRYVYAKHGVPFFRPLRLVRALAKHRLAVARGNDFDIRYWDAVLRSLREPRLDRLA